LPYDNPEQLIYYLQATHKGSNTQEVRNATEVLFAMSKDLVRFTNSLMYIIMNNENNDMIENIKTSACMTLAAFLSNTGDQIILTETKEHILQSVLRAMFSKDVVLSLKVTLQAILDELYQKDSGLDFKNKSLLFIKEKLNYGSLEEFSGAFIVLQRVILTPGVSRETIAKWFFNLRENLVQSGATLIDAIIKEMKEAINSSNSIEKFANVFMGLKILKIWVVNIRYFIDLLGKPIKISGNKKKYTSHLSTVTSCGPLVEVLSNILTLQIPTEKQLQDCLFSTSGITGVDQILNGVKGSVIQCFNKSLDYLLSSRTYLDPDHNKFYGFSRDAGVKGILHSVLVFCESPSISLEEIGEHGDLQDCLVESLAFLTHLATYSEIYDLLSSCYKKLVFNVCLPLMRTTSQELEKFQNNPKEFVMLATDTCDDQKSKIAKTQAAQLLENICDNIDGSLKFVVSVSLAIMECSLHGDFTSLASEKIALLNDYQNSLFISQTDPKIQLDTCIVALSVLSYLVRQRKDLILDVEDLLIRYKEYFFNEKNDALIKSRMCLFIGYYFEHLFQEKSKKEYFALQLVFITEALSDHQKGILAVSEQAIDALESIILQDNIKTIIAPIIGEIVERLSYYMEFVETPDFFDIINELFTNYKKELLADPKLISLLICGMVKRVQISNDVVKTDNKNEKIILSKIWNILRLLGRDPNFIPKYQDDIELLMEPLFNLFENDEQVSFEDDMLIYITIVTKLAQRVSDSCWKTLKTFPRIFFRSKGILSSLFPALNQIILIGRYTLSKDPSSIQALVEIGVQGLNPTHEKATEANSLEAALLLQLIFQCLGGISGQDWERIIVACIEKLKSTDKGYLKTKLVGVILCAFMSNFELTWTVMHNQHFMGKMLTLCLDEVTIFEHVYDRKLLLIGLCNLLVRGFEDPAIQDNLQKIFNNLIGLLKFVEFMDQRGAKLKSRSAGPKEEHFLVAPKDVLEQFISNGVDKGGKKKSSFEEEEDDEDYVDVDDDGDDNDDDTDSDDNDDDSDDEFFMQPDEAEAKILLDLFESEVTKRDEFIFFRESVFSIKEKNENLLLELVKKLPSTKREYLKQILHSKRVVVEEKNGHQETEARKIVKARTRKVANNINFDN